MIKHITTTPAKALEKLKAGNARYINAKVNSEDIFITDKIKAAIGDECDPYKAACLNVKSCEAEIEASLEIQKVEHQEGLRIVGAMYHLENGLVDFI